MMQTRSAAGAAALAVLLAAGLAGCGGSDDPAMPPVSTAPAAPVAQPSSAEVVATTAGRIESVALSGGKAWIAVANSLAADSGVFAAALPLKTTSAWSGILIGDCGLAREENGMPLRGPGLRAFDGGLWLFQTVYDQGPDARPEHPLCRLATTADGTTLFQPHDDALNVCEGGVCATLSISELRQANGRLYANAGGGRNVAASNDQGATWHALVGSLAPDFCYDGAFEVVGDRLLVGGECPLDSAYLQAYALGADGISLAAKEPVAVAVPDLENRNVQFIRAVGAQRVFAGVEGGLLRSEDGGRSFKFVIRHALGDATSNPYIRHVLALSAKPDTIVTGGFDKASQKPFLAWSADGGANWTDISALLPGYARNLDDPSPAMVTGLAEDPQGRIVVTVNEQENARGRVVLVTLGTPGK